MLASSSDRAGHGSDQPLRRALQHSERQRLLLFLVLLVVAFGLGWIRHLEGEQDLQGPAFYWLVLLAGIITGYAGFMLLLVGGANRRGRLLPDSVWGVSVIFEAAAPTMVLFVLQAVSPLGPVEALTAPAILLYGAVIVVSVLRLRPLLVLTSGFVAAAGHLGLLAYALLVRPESRSIDLPFHLTYPFLIALTGAAAAWVTFEVRKYVLASLREAETRRTLSLMRQEMDIARSIQQGLLPKKRPDLPGFEIVGWNRPAGETGGDYYDWQPLDDGRLAVVIADVAGHGLGPALLMAVCRAYARACVPFVPELRSALERVNVLLSDDIKDGRFVTLASAVLDSESGTFEMLSAGHGPILLLRSRAGQIDELDSHGLPLGLVAGECYEQPVRINMSPGDILLLVTDGFVERSRPDDGELYGTGRLRAFLENHATLDLDHFIQQLSAEVDSFGAGTVQADDMTVVVIRRC